MITCVSEYMITSIVNHFTRNVNTRTLKIYTSYLGAAMLQGWLAMIVIKYSLITSKYFVVPDLRS